MILVAVAAPLLGAERDPARHVPPAFADANRRQVVEALLPEIDQIFQEYAAEHHVPGAAYGIVLDGKLIHQRAIGLANLERKFPVNAATRFRIASMSKSFVALAALKLRDEGKLRLDDPVEKYLPELRRVRPPTKDSPRMTVWNLMTMTTGLPEDNPWGDQQLAIGAGSLRKFIGGGLSFSNPTGQQFEYSNLGFVLLGQVVSKVAGMPFQRYITKNILLPLGMTQTVWEFSDVPPAELALGYRWEDEQWKLEPMLHDGEGAAAGGLLTTIDDFSKYVAFHLDAWPPRDDPERGPVRRSTVREMHFPRTVNGINAKSLMPDGTTPNPAVYGYAYGLGWAVDTRHIRRISHTGGLPGFGSIYVFLPEYGLGLMAFSNLTYTALSEPTTRAALLLLAPGKLERRATVAPPILEERKQQVAKLLTTWDVQLGREILAENFFLDRSRDHWIELTREKFAELGAIQSVGPIEPENQLRGEFFINGERGKIGVHFTLTPEAAPKVQELELNFVPANP